MISDLIALERPLISVDLETTGIYSNVDRICQIGVLKLYPDGRLTEWETLIDPGIPIPENVTAVHHIDNDKVKDAPLFETIAEKLYAGLNNCDLTGYNARAFDVKFLIEEFRRCNLNFKPGIVVDTFNIFKRYNPRNLTAAVQFYLGEDLVDAHSALADARASFRVLRAQLLKHEDLPRTIAGIDSLFKQNPDFVDPEGKIMFNKDGKAIFNFGQNKGMLLEKCGHGYFQWILNANFSSEIKKIMTDALSGKFPKR